LPLVHFKHSRESDWDPKESFEMVSLESGIT